MNILSIKSSTLFFLTFSFLCLISISLQSVARDSAEERFKRSADKLCDKMTRCMLDQMAQEGDELPPQMAQMVEQMAQNMCDSLYDFEEIMDNNKVDEVESAVACLESVEQQTCDVINDGFETPECKSFEAKIAKYSNRN